MFGQDPQLRRYRAKLYPKNKEKEANNICRMIYKPQQQTYEALARRKWTYFKG